MACQPSSQDVCTTNGHHPTTNPRPRLRVALTLALLFWAEPGLGNEVRIERVGGYDTPGWAAGVAVSGNCAYVADAYEGLQVIDVSNPANPQWVRGYNTPGFARRVAIRDRYAYVADGERYWQATHDYIGSFQVFDVSNPANTPRWVGYSDTPGVALGVAVRGHYAYVADGRRYIGSVYIASLQVIDVSNPVSPRRVGNYETFGEPAMDVAVSGRYAYVARWASGLQVIDVRDPVNPRWVGEYDTPGSALGVAVSGSYAYVADGSSLQVIDVSDPAKPRLVGSYAPFDMALSVLVNGKYAYVVDRNAGLRVIDVCNPSNLRKVGGYDTSALAFGVAISGNYAYLANWDAGLQVLRIEAVAPQVVVEPSRRTLNGGEDATFTATVQGLGPAYYQWFKDGIALPGQNGAVLARPGVREADSGRYEVVVRDECGRGGSATATLAVLVPGSGGRAEERIEVSPSVPPAPQGSSLVLITHGWAPFGGAG